MTILRLINIAAWLVVLAYMLPSAASIMRGNARTGDPARLVCASFAVMVMGFNLRQLLAHESVAAQVGLLMLSIVIAIYTVVVARTYGRGNHV